MLLSTPCIEYFISTLKLELYFLIKYRKFIHTKHSRLGAPDALTKLRGREGGEGAESAILPYVGHLQLISTFKIGADCCQLCQYKLTKPNLTLPNLTYHSPEE